MTVNNEFEGLWEERQLPNLRYYTHICISRHSGLLQQTSTKTFSVLAKIPSRHQPNNNQERHRSSQVTQSLLSVPQRWANFLLNVVLHIKPECWELISLGNVLPHLHHLLCVSEAYQLTDPVAAVLASATNVLRRNTCLAALQKLLLNEFIILLLTLFKS
jgi:hypothetical protein